MKDRINESNKITIKNIIGNIVLSVSKVACGILGNSQSLLADGFHSVSDVVTSVGVLISNKISSSSNDGSNKKHRYGLEKVETLAALLLSIVLILVALEIGEKALIYLFNPELISAPSGIAIIVALVSIFVKEYQYRETMKVANAINSDSLRADAIHHRSDSLSSIAVLIGVAGSIISGWKILEPIASIFVTVCILHAAIEILQKSGSELLDISIGEEAEKEIVEFIHSTGLVNNVTELKTRKHGSTSFIDIDVCIDGRLSVTEGHDIVHELEEEILSKFSAVKAITIHMEPCASRKCGNKCRHICCA